MSKIEIKTSNKNAFGQVRSLPIDGEVTIGEDGVVEVSEECAALIVDGGSYTYADEEDDTEEQLEAARKADEEAAAKEAGENGEDDDDGNEFASETEILKFIAKLKNENITEVIKQNGLDKADPEGFKKATTKAKLVAYIKANMTDDIRGAVSELLT